MFQEVTVVEKALVYQIISTVEELYLADIRNCTTNYINDTNVEMLNRLQENYSQLMPHELLEPKDIVNNTIYNPWDTISTVFSAVE